MWGGANIIWIATDKYIDICISHRFSDCILGVHIILCHPEGYFDSLGHGKLLWPYFGHSSFYLNLIVWTCRNLGPLPAAQKLVSHRIIK